MEYWIWLQELLKYGNGRVRAVLDRFNNAVGVWDATNEQLKESGLFTKNELQKFSRSLKSAKETVTLCKENGISIITPDDSKYPNSLRNIPDLPLVLYVKGEMPDFNSLPSVCIVGPRKCSQFGRKASYSLSARLARSGMIIVSGGALGVDSEAHRAAMNEGGITVALLACGINFDYLKANEDLREEIIKHGCLISEFPPNYSLKNGAFQIRNRLMSALSLGTVVIEAGEKSGALITARCANEQGKDVFVIPGSPALPQYEGSNKLIRDGAKPLLDAMDVLSEYIDNYSDKINIDAAFASPIKYRTGSKEQEKPVLPPKKDANGLALTPIAEAMYSVIPDNPFCIDELPLFNEYNASELITAISELEIRGLVKAVVGGRYQRIK